MKILYFSNVNWNWIKQRPHFLSSELSKLEDNHVTFLSLTPFLKQKKSNFSNQENLKIRDLYSIPFSFKVPIIRQLNRIVISLFIEKEFDVIVLTHPMQIDYLKTFKYKTLVYDCMDNIPEFYSGRLRAKVDEKEQKLCSMSSCIITSSEYLKNRLANQNKVPGKIKVIRNALNSDIVKYEKLNLYLEKPNIGYIGTIDKWFDVEAVKWIASKYKNLTIYLVGPASRDIQEKLSIPNIKFVGKIEHTMVTSYIHELDILLIPFIQSPLIDAVDPVKIYEFLAFGKRVVSSYWKEIEYLRDQIKIYHDINELGEILDNLYSNVHKDIVDSNYILNNSWKKRSEEFSKCLILQLEKNNVV